MCTFLESGVLICQPANIFLGILWAPLCFSIPCFLCKQHNSWNQLQDNCFVLTFAVLPRIEVWTYSLRNILSCLEHEALNSGSLAGVIRQLTELQEVAGLQGEEVAGIVGL